MATERTTSSRLGGFVIAAVIVVGAFFVGGITGCFNPFGSSEYTQVGSSVVESVQALADLTTVEMVEYTTVEKGNDAGWLNWARGDRIFLFAVARIGGGLDFDQIDVEDFVADEDTGRVTLQMPRAEVQFIEVDEDQTQVYDRDTGLFTKGEAQLESDARAVARDVLLQGALDRGILELAQENARTTLSDFLLSLGFSEIQFIEPAPTP